MTAIAIEKCKNGWIVRDLYQQGIFGTTTTVSVPSSHYVYQTIEQIQQAIPMLLEQDIVVPAAHSETYCKVPKDK